MLFIPAAATQQLPTKPAVFGTYAIGIAVQGGARNVVGDVNVILGKPSESEGGNNTINNNGLIQLTQITGHNAAQNATFSGVSNFNNNATGTLSLVNGFAGDKITINGNYNATTGAKVKMDVAAEWRFFCIRQTRHQRQRIGRYQSLRHQRGRHRWANNQWHQLD